MKNTKRKIKKNSGQAMMISVVFFLFISLAIIAGLVSPSVREFKIAGDLIKSRQSFFLSESGVEDAYFRLKNAKPIGSSVEITLDGNSVTTNITDSGYNEKTITSLGDTSLRQRKNEIILSTGTGISFNYGIQAGLGGFVMSNNAGVNGNVYSNADITGSNNAFINGTAIAAGSTGTISDVLIGQNETDNAHAHTVNNSTISGNLYCKTGSGNNKSCDISLPDPEPIPMPITQAMIDQWKADAALGGTVPGNLTISTPTSLGPKKITGDLIIDADLTLTGTVYVIGTITASNNRHISLSPSYGATGGILLTDSPINLSNNVIFEGSGSANSYIMLLTSSACPTTGCASTNALEIANNVGAVILNAQNGTAHMSNNVTLNEIVANKIMMDNNAVVNYLSGLANTAFTSGPSGGWNVKSWKEIK